jgi:hypothetical protein
MAFRLVGGFPENYIVEATVTAGVAIAEGDFLDMNGNVLQRGTSSSTIHTAFGVAAETISTTATTIKVIPFIDGQLWEVDVANNTATTQLYEGMVLTDHDTVNNSDTTVTGPTAVFTPVRIVGAAADKKMQGFVHHLHPTST